MAGHYGVAVVPARPLKPRDKAKVEAGVFVVERWILAALRKRKFFTLAELNLADCGIYRPAERVLRALPPERYQYGAWETHRVNIDCHVCFDHHWYSVPYQLTQQEVEVRATAATIEIFHRGVRSASHARSHLADRATTVAEHRPKAHQPHLEWTPSRLVEWAATVGPVTAQLFEQSHLRQTPFGTRLPLLSRHSAARQAVLPATSGSCRKPCHCPERLLLPERESHSEMQSGQPAHRAGDPPEAAAGASQYPWSEILRSARTTERALNREQQKREEEFMLTPPTNRETMHYARARNG